MNGISLGRMTIQLLGARGIRFSVALISSIIIARSLGVEGLGAYAYALGIAALFALIPNMGVSTLVTQSIAKGHEASDAMVRAAFVAQALLAVGVMALVMGFALLLPNQKVPFAYVVLAAVQLGTNSLSWPYLAILSGHSRFDRMASAEMTTAVVPMPLIIAVALLHNTVAGFLLVQVAASLLALFIARRAARPWLPEAGERYPLLTLFRQAIPFGAAGSLTSLYGRFDLILLGQMASIAAVGLFNAAFKPVTIMLYIGMTVAGIIFPLMSNLHHGVVPHSFSRLMRAVGVLAPAMALAVGGLGYWVLRLAFGPAYGSASLTLAILIWSVAARWIYAPLAQALQARGQVRWWLVALAGGVLLNLAVNWWAIPRWWADGAALARLISEVYLLMASALLVHFKLGIRLPLEAVLKIVVSLAAALAAMQALKASGSLAATGAALAVYFGLLMVLRLVFLSDVRTVFGWVRDAVLHRGHT
jgi:O-antigen/teichoic acid export membrane protein